MSLSSDPLRFEVPEAFQNHIEERIASLGFSLRNPKPLAQAVLRLSDFFIRGINPQNTDDYWKEPAHHAAYLSYFSVLNFVRARAVFAEARKTRFLLDSRQVIDWGCGSGAASLALATECPTFLPALKIFGMDKSAVALREYSLWLKASGLNVETAIGDLRQLDFTTTLEEAKRIGLNQADTLIFSYVINEIANLEEEDIGYPKIPENIQRLVIIEPSTNQAGRKLLAFRDKLIEKGWFAWAPCTHQEFCPLYNQSGRDWCHHRVHWKKPDWFYDLEETLPMRNDTLTLSYILLSRQKPLKDLAGLARVVGDEQAERGKTRQMICRGMNREFLSWLDRNRLKPGMHRGDIIRIRDGIVKPKEIRISFMTDIEKIDPEPQG